MPPVSPEPIQLICQLTVTRIVYCWFGWFLELTV
jgi:hypothetical protein